MTDLQPTLAATLPLRAYDNIESLAAAAYAQGRACLPLLRGTVVPALQRFTPERVIALIETRNLLSEPSVTDIEILLDLLARLVAQGTTEVLRSSAEVEGQVTEPRD